jgi:hypothetical protein
MGGAAIPKGCPASSRVTTTTKVIPGNCRQKYVEDFISKVKTICHLSFAICHLSFVINDDQSFISGSPAMTNDK